MKTDDHISSEECLVTRETKKADVEKHPKVFHHVGLLVNEPSSYAGMLFIKSSDRL